MSNKATLVGYYHERKHLLRTHCFSDEKVPKTNVEVTFLMVAWPSPSVCRGSYLWLGQGPTLSAAAEVEMKRCLGQQRCTQHSATQPGGTKSLLSVSFWTSCWKVTSPWLNGRIHLLKSAQFVNHFFSTRQSLHSARLSSRNKYASRRMSEWQLL